MRVAYDLGCQTERQEIIRESCDEYHQHNNRLATNELDLVATFGGIDVRDCAFIADHLLAHQAT